MQHGFSLDSGEAHLMFLAERETVLAAGGGIGGRLATRFALAGLLSFRSGSREDARFGLPLFGYPHSAPEWTVLRGGA